MTKSDECRDTPCKASVRSIAPQPTSQWVVIVADGYKIGPGGTLTLYYSGTDTTYAPGAWEYVTPISQEASS